MDKNAEGITEAGIIPVWGRRTVFNDIAVSYDRKQGFVSASAMCFMYVLAGSGFWLFLQEAGRNYMRLQGQCIRIDTEGLRKRVQAVHLALEQGNVKILVRYRISKLSEGDTIVVYVAEKTPVYERDGEYIIGNYYAMEIRR